MADVHSHFHFSKTQDHPMNIAWYGYEFKIMLTSVTLRSFIQQNWIKLTSIKSPVNKPVPRKVPRLSIQYCTHSFLIKFQNISIRCCQCFFHKRMYYFRTKTLAFAQQCHFLYHYRHAWTPDIPSVWKLLRYSILQRHGGYCWFCTH